MYWNDDYLILALGDKFVCNCHNNSTHIFNVSMHAGMMDIHIWLSWSWKMLFDIYNDHEASQSFNRKFYHQFENKDTNFHVDRVSLMLFELKDYVGIDGNVH